MLSQPPPCPVCATPGGEPFYVARGVPTNSCLVVDTEEAARHCRRGDIELVGCTTCGFVHNRAFLPERTVYDERYQSSQACSPTFNAFAADLARRIGAHFGIGGGRVVEVGCGGGDFLGVLVETLGLDEAVGVDPAAPPPAQAPPRIRYVRETLSAALADAFAADLVVCRMTLEHIPAPAAFTALLARLADGRDGAGLFVAVPAVERILERTAFWDVYYEHCNYFGADSLAYLLSAHGFGDIVVRHDFEGQYLSAFARPAGDVGRITPRPMAAARIAGFQAAANRIVERWSSWLACCRARGETVVLWGSGSKAVAFLHALPRPADVTAVVDINPARHGQFVAGSAHRIVAPEVLTALRPSHVVVMNANYRAEIDRSLRALGLDATTVALD